MSKLNWDKDTLWTELFELSELFQFSMIFQFSEIFQLSVGDSKVKFFQLLPCERLCCGGAPHIFQMKKSANMSDKVELLEI